MIYIYSFYIWGILIFAWFAFQRYQSASNKKLFLRSSYVQAILWPILITGSTVILVNLVAPKKIEIPETTKEERTEQIKQSEFDLRKKVEEDLTNIDLNYEYINTHYYNNPTPDNDYEIENFYSDKTFFSDQNYRDIGHFGLGFCYFKTNRPDKAKLELDSIKNKKLSYVNYLKGSIALEQRDTIAGIEYLKKELLITTKNNYTTLVLLFSIYSQQHSYKEIYALGKQYNLREYFSTGDLRKIYIINNDIINYTLTELQRFKSYLTFSTFSTALLISFVWFFYLYKMDFYERENGFYLLGIFLISCVSCLFSTPLYDIYAFYFNFTLNGYIWNDLLYSVFGIGAIEELVKLIPLLLILFLTNKISEPYDYILYACTSALGFAFMENLIYLQKESSFIIQQRTLYAAIGHMCDSAIFAYGLVLTKFRYKNFNPILGFLLSFLAAATAHGIYDFILFQNSYLIFNLFFFFEISLFVLIINNCLNNSTFFTYSIKPNDRKLDLIIAVSLSGIIAFQYTLNAFSKGLEEANHSLINSYISGGFIIIFFIYKLSRLDMVKNHWFGFTRYINKKEENLSTISLVISFIVGNSINPNNYVGTNVKFKIDSINVKLFPLNLPPIKGIIYDRLVLENKKMEGGHYLDPYYFLVKLEQAINLNGEIFHAVIIRFENADSLLMHYANRPAKIFFVSTARADNPPSLLFKGTVLVTAII